MKNFSHQHNFTHHSFNLMSSVNVDVKGRWNYSKKRFNIIEMFHPLTRHHHPRRFARGKGDNKEGSVKNSLKVIYDSDSRMWKKETNVGVCSYVMAIVVYDEEKSGTKKKKIVNWEEKIFITTIVLNHPEDERRKNMIYVVQSMRTFI